MMKTVTGTAIQMCGFQGKNRTCLQPNFGSSSKAELNTFGPYQKNAAFLSSRIFWRPGLWSQLLSAVLF